MSEKPVCFVIMPISDVHGYETGHFSRVYEYIFKPAIESAGFEPVRADDTVKTDYIVVGIIQKIIDSEMVLCDFSARNPNVMYELGIRHAFNKPVVLLKDGKTDKVFDIQGLRFTEYDSSLRVDTVSKDIAKISNAVKETHESKDSINSIIQLAQIKAAEIPENRMISADTQLLLTAIASLEKRVVKVESVSDQTAYFKIHNNIVKFDDGNGKAEIGEEIYDENHKTIGELVDIHPGDNKIFIKTESGKIIPYNAYSIKSKGLNTCPF